MGNPVMMACRAVEHIFQARAQIKQEPGQEDKTRTKQSFHVDNESIQINAYSICFGVHEVAMCVVFVECFQFRVVLNATLH